VTVAKWVTQPAVRFEYRHSYTGETIRTTLRGVPQLAFCLAVALKPGCFRQFLAETYPAS